MTASFLMTGSQSTAAAQAHKEQQELQEATKGNLFRFFLKAGEEASVTFVDGALVGGVLEPPRCFEHTVQQAGKWVNIVCPQATMPHLGYKCPLCETGDKPALIAVFTVIDHRSFTSKTTNKVYVNSRKLLVAKSRSMELLNQMAIKRGGLVGARFDVKRTNADAANIGDFWDFTSKTDPNQLMQQYVYETTVNNQKVLATSFQVADYNNELIFRTPEEMLKMGFGAAHQMAKAQLQPGGNAPVLMLPPQQLAAAPAAQSPLFAAQAPLVLQASPPAQPVDLPAPDAAAAWDSLF